MEQITIDNGYAILVFNEEEVTQMHFDLTNLADCVMAIINPKVADECWDVPIKSEDAREKAREILSRMDIDEEFLNKVFG